MKPFVDFYFHYLLCTTTCISRRAEMLEQKTGGCLFAVRLYALVRRFFADKAVAGRMVTI